MAMRAVTVVVAGAITEPLASSSLTRSLAIPFPFAVSHFRFHHRLHRVS
jgi:hypothetical protein